MRSVYFTDVIFAKDSQQLTENNEDLRFGILGC